LTALIVAVPCGRSIDVLPISIRPMRMPS
jgi:hypothetical protein